MKVTFLGTGTSQGVPVIACDCEVCTSEDPRDKRLRTSVMVEVADKTLVIDTGPDFRQQMLREKVQKVDAILFTHAHKDHTAGLDDVRAFNFKHRMDMPIYADHRVQESLRRDYYYAFEKDPYPGIPRLELIEIENAVFEALGIEVIPIEVMHARLPVLGFRIGDFAYITDMKTISEQEMSKLKGCKTLVLNALRRESHVSHLTVDEAIAIAKKVNAESTYFTHMSHLIGRHKQLEKELPVGMSYAYDGLQVQV